MNDTQSMARQRGGGPNQNFNSQRQGNFSGNISGGSSGFNNNVNQFDGPPSNNYNSYSGGGNYGNNYPMNNQAGGGVKRPMSVSFTMKIRGVPFDRGLNRKFYIFEF
jgi:hypothetical protein